MIPTRAKVCTVGHTTCMHCSALEIQIRETIGGSKNISERTDDAETLIGEIWISSIKLIAHKAHSLTYSSASLTLHTVRSTRRLKRQPGTTRIRGALPARLYSAWGSPIRSFTLGSSYRQTSSSTALHCRNGLLVRSKPAEHSSLFVFCQELAYGLYVHENGATSRFPS